MGPIDHYWTFDLSPYVFQVKNLNFQWVTTWWGIISLVVVFGGGILLTTKKKSKYSEFCQTSLIYLLIIGIILFVLQKMKIDWGLRWYSTMYLVGFVAVYLGSLVWVRKKTLMMTENMIMEFVTFCIIGMLVGARSAYVFIYNWHYYKLHPLEAIATWEGGLSFHGGIIGVCLAIFLFCKKYQIPFFHLTDKIVRVIPIGIGLGRVGNFMNGELWGRPIESHVPWAIVFPEAGSVPRHPSQIYQSLGEGWLLFLTLYVISRFKHREGTLSAFFLIFYCFYRFFVEYFRAADAQVNYFYVEYLTWAPLNAYPEARWWQILTMGQILCLLFLLVGGVLLFLARKRILEGSTEWTFRTQQFFKNHEGKKVES